MTPNLRFPEFNGIWTTVKVEEEYIFKNGLNKEKEFFGRGFSIVNFTDVYHNPILSLSQCKGLVDVNNSEKDRFKVSYGDIMFTRTSETIHDIGMSSAVVDEEVNAVFSGFVLRATPKSNNLIPHFAGYLFRSPSVRKEIVRKSSFTTRALTSGTSLSAVLISYPNNTEQTKIAELLRLVDQKINLITKKKEALETYKNGLMQKIFSQELRFKREDGTDYPDWDCQPLGDLAYITSGKSNREDSDTDAKYHFFDRSSDVRRSGIYLYDDDAVIVAGEGQEFIPKKFSGKFDLHQRAYAIMKFGDGLSYEYCYYFIFHHRRYFERMAVGTTVLSLRLPMFQKMMIQLPSMEEQDKIVAVLTNIDSYLKNVSNGIQSTESLKKGLLQQMFV